MIIVSTLYHTILPFNHSNMDTRNDSPVQDFLRVLGCRPPVFLTGELASFPGHSATKAYSACTCPKGAIDSVPIARIWLNKSTISIYVTHWPFIIRSL